MISGPIKIGLVNLREKVRIAREGAHDTWRTLRWSSRVDNAFTPNDRWSLECQMTKDYHRVEKGLALASPKRPFGEAVLARLSSGTQSLEAGSVLQKQVMSAADALAAWNSSAKIDDKVAPVLAQIAAPKDASIPSDNWFRSRHSVRNFSKSTIPNTAEVTEAIALASSSTPSVCNRQAWRAYVATDPLRVRHLLSLQNGNAGFRDSVPAVVVFTASRRLFAGAGERHQMYVDGALFAMSTAWVLHARGLSSCMLNWSMGNSHSADLREAVGAEPDEEIIAMMAVGYAAIDARVARSPRRRSEDVVRIVK